MPFNSYFIYPIISQKVLERKITKNEQISVCPIEGYGKIGWYGIQVPIAFGSESVDGNVILAFDWLGVVRLKEP
jgi:hypothetical protein